MKMGREQAEREQARYEQGLKDMEIRMEVEKKRREEEVEAESPSDRKLSKKFLVRDPAGLGLRPADLMAAQTIALQ